MKSFTLCAVALAMVLGLAVADYGSYGSSYGSSYGGGYGYGALPFYGGLGGYGSAGAGTGAGGVGQGGILMLVGLLFLLLVIFRSQNTTPTTSTVTVG